MKVQETGRDRKLYGIDREEPPPESDDVFAKKGERENLELVSGPEFRTQAEGEARLKLQGWKGLQHEGEGASHLNIASGTHSKF